LKNETNILIDIFSPVALNQIDISAMKVSFQECRYHRSSNFEKLKKFMISRIVARTAEFNAIYQEFNRS